MRRKSTTTGVHAAHCDSWTLPCVSSARSLYRQHGLSGLRGAWPFSFLESQARQQVVARVNTTLNVIVKDVSVVTPFFPPAHFFFFIPFLFFSFLSRGQNDHDRELSVKEREGKKEKRCGGRGTTLPSISRSLSVCWPVVNATPPM